MTDQPKLSIAIMSYNRGLYLRNLLDSIERHCPDAVTFVVDDRSDDPDTLAVLEACPQAVFTSNGTLENRHGNLYRNMQKALEVCETPYLLFLQDDTQIVRDVTARDMEIFIDAFSDPDLAFLRPSFMKKSDCDNFIPHVDADVARGLIMPKETYADVRLGNAYCDVVMCDVAKLRGVNWTFKYTERANQIEAQTHFSSMPFLWSPCAFYCPEVPSYRDRKLYLASRLVQRKRRGVVARYNSIEGAALEDFMGRTEGSWPIAEHVLIPNLDDIADPFVFQDYSKTPWLHALYKVESRLWRMIKPVIKLVSKGT